MFVMACMVAAAVASGGGPAIGAAPPAAAQALHEPGSSSAARWRALPGSGRVEFVLHTFWHDVEGATTSLTADLVSGSGDLLTDGMVEISVDAGALETGIGRRDRKMREDHLETAKYPRIEFRSTAPPRRAGDPGAADPAAGARSRPDRARVTGPDAAMTSPAPAGGGGQAHAGSVRDGNAPQGPGAVQVLVEGDLMLHGVTRRVEARVEAAPLPDGWLMKGAFPVRLTEHGIPDPSIALNRVQDEVDVRFEIRFTGVGSGAGN